MNEWMGNENESNQSSNQSRNQINGFKLFLLSYFPTFCSDLWSVFVNRVLNKSVKYPIAQTTVTKQVIGLDHRSDPEAWWLQRSLLIQLPIKANGRSIFSLYVFHPVITLYQATPEEKRTSKEGCRSSFLISNDFETK